MKRIGVVLILLLAFCGLADSAYLAQSEVNRVPLVCNIEGLSGCNVVAHSQYSQLFGVPVSEYGVLFYSILFVLAALELVLFDQKLRRVLQALALIGILASLYFSFVQVFLIGALCIYCIASAIITLLVFIAAAFIEPVRAEKLSVPAASPVSPRLPMPPAA